MHQCRLWEKKSSSVIFRNFRPKEDSGYTGGDLLKIVDQTKPSELWEKVKQVAELREISSWFSLGDRNSLFRECNCWNTKKKRFNPEFKNDIHDTLPLMMEGNLVPKWKMKVYTQHILGTYKRVQRFFRSLSRFKVDGYSALSKNLESS